jgi:hypothetical protein
VDRQEQAGRSKQELTPSAFVAVQKAINRLRLAFPMVFRIDLITEQLARQLKNFPMKTGLPFVWQIFIRHSQIALILPRFRKQAVSY